MENRLPLPVVSWSSSLNSAVRGAPRQLGNSQLNISRKKATSAPLVGSDGTRGGDPGARAAAVAARHRFRCGATTADGLST